MKLIKHLSNRFFCGIAVVSLIALGACWDPIRDPNRPVREIGSSGKIAAWALQQKDPFQQFRALIVLFDRAAAAETSNDTEEAIHAYLQILNTIEDYPRNKNVPNLLSTKNSSETTTQDFVVGAYNSAAFEASESVRGTGVFLRIRPDSQHAQWLPEWQHELDALEETWAKRQQQIGRAP